MGLTQILENLRHRGPRAARDLEGSLSPHRLPGGRKEQDPHETPDGVEESGPHELALFHGRAWATDCRSARTWRETSQGGLMPRGTHETMKCSATPLGARSAFRSGSHVL